jgi:hypothetical protein
MMHGNHPNFSGLDQIVEAVEFEPMYRSAPHISEADAVNFRVVGEPFGRQVHLLQELRAQPGSFRVIPERRLHRVGVSGRKDS